MEGKITLILILLFCESAVGWKRCPEHYTKYKRSCYRIFPYRMTWIEANEFCKLDKAHLVYVNSKEEANFLKSKARRQAGISHSLWTGIIEKNTGHDLRFAGNNRKANYLAFKHGEPSIVLRDDFVALNWNNHGLLEDWTDGTKFSFICEK